MPKYHLVEFDKETNVDAEDKIGAREKIRSGRKRQKDGARLSCCRGFRVFVPTYKSMQQRLTWNLEPRWDDCKVGGGGKSERRGC